ncbi:MAG TPA: ABC transporter permease subunit, partial [Myxococcota bacterium]|nr:ABC transporter permease subunit [Myxococcota bacterium]
AAAPGIVLAMVIVSAPFIVKAAREGFAAVPVRLEQVAWSLGAGEARTFLTVALPLARPSIAVGAQLAWARAVSEFGSVVILAYYPKTAPVLIWDRFSTGGLAAALPPAVLLLGVCGGAFLLLRLAPGRRR